MVMKGIFGLILLCLISYIQSFATPYGAYIGYTFLDSGRYEVKLWLYRDCRSTPYSGTMTYKVLEHRNSGNNVNRTATLSKIEFASRFCLGSTNCVPSNTYGGGEGYEVFCYLDTLDFKSDSKLNNLSKVDEIRFEYSTCCRSGALTNGGGSQNFYTYSYLNRKFGEGNSSPELTYHPEFIVGEGISYKSAVAFRDSKDLDSLSFKMVPMWNAYSSPIGYVGSLKPDKPLSVYYVGKIQYPYSNTNADPVVGFYFDTLTGMMAFTPTNAAEAVVFVTEVSDWKKDSSGKYQLRGVVRLDWMVTTKTMTRNIPKFDKLVSSHNACPGEKICFDISATDKDYINGDSVILSWDSGIPKGTFKILNPGNRLERAQFCWTPGNDDVNDIPHKFLVEARDKYCPYNLYANIFYTIKVQPKLTSEVHAIQKSCNQLSYKILKNPGNDDEFSVKVFNSQSSLISDSRILSFSNGKTSSVLNEDTLSIYRNGTYFIQFAKKKTGYCDVTWFDTLVVTQAEAELISVIDTFHCTKTTLNLSADLYKGKELITWHTGISSDTGVLLKYDIDLPTNVIRLSFIDSAGCERSDFVDIESFGIPFVNLGPDTLLCGSYQLKLGGPVAGNSQWNHIQYKWHNASTDDSMVMTTHGLKTLEAGNACGKTSDSVFIQDKLNILRPVSEVYICNDVPVQIKSQLNGKSYRWENSNTDTFSFYTVKTSGTYTCETELICGDKVQENISVDEVLTPDLGLPEEAVFCEGSFVDVVSGIWDEHSSWKWTDLNTDSVRRFTKAGKYTIVVDNLCGTYLDSVTIKELKAPEVDLGNDTVYCGKFTRTYALKAGEAEYIWHDQTRGPNYTINQPGKYWVVAENYCGKDTSEIEIGLSFYPEVDLGRDTMLKTPFNLLLDAGNMGAQRTWSTSDTGRTILVNQFGWYWVKVQTPCGQVEDSILVSELVGISEKETGYRIYPIPAANYLIIPEELVLTQITDMTGRNLGTFNLESDSRVDISPLKNGTYILKAYKKTEPGMELRIVFQVMKN